MRFAFVRIIMVGCIFLLSLTASSNTCVGHEKRAQVHAVCGRIYNELGDLAKGAELTLRDANGAVLYNATIDQRGIFSFGLVTKGDYTLRATAPGYLPEERKIRVTGNQEKSCRATVDVKLGVTACAGGIFLKGVDKRPSN